MRKWKLHHERNFWRNHTSKDDVVNALHAYMRERRRLEDLKREIAAKREAMTQAGKGRGRGGSDLTMCKCQFPSPFAPLRADPLFVCQV